MRGTWQSFEIASLRAEHHVVQGSVRNDNLYVHKISILIFVLVSDFVLRI